MKNLKNILIATMTLLTLNTTFASTSTFNESAATYCFEDGDVLALEIPQLNLSADIQLLQNTYDAPVIVKLSSERGTAEIVIDSEHGLIRGDGIIARLIRGDGISARITGDGIIALITGDGIIARVTVMQLGSVLFSDEL